MTRSAVFARAFGVVVPVLLTCLVLSFPNPALADPGKGGRLSIDPSKPVVVSMGDSYSSGEGCPPFYGSRLAKKGTGELRDWTAHRSKASWPGKLDLGDGPLADQKDGNWLFVASSGAESRHIYKDRQVKKFTRLTGWQGHSNIIYSKIKLPKQDYIFDLLEESGAKADLVTLTIGGNDLGFADMVGALATSRWSVSGVWDAAVNALDTYDIGRIDEKTGKRDEPAKDMILESYKDIRRKAGKQARILVAGYPYLVADRDTLLWSIDNARIVNSCVLILDERLDGLVKEADAWDGKDTAGYSFVDVRGAFGKTAHGVGSDEAWISHLSVKRFEDLGPGIPVSARTFHPKWCGKSDCGEKGPDCGISAYAHAVQEEINKLKKAGYSFGKADKQDADSQSMHITMDGYEFDLPAYWKGKVDIVSETNEYGYPSKVVYLDKSHDKKTILVRIGKVPAGGPHWPGDFMGHAMYAKSDDGSIVVSVKAINWPAHALGVVNGRTPGGNALTTDLRKLRSLVDLSVGGEYSFEQIVSGEMAEEDVNAIEIEHTQKICDSIRFSKTSPPGEDANVLAREAWAYYGKVAEIQREYGKPDVAFHGDDSYCTGLAYAALKDFGDGKNRLVVCYYDPSLDEDPDYPGGGQSCYPVEVWEYDSRLNSLSQVFAGEAALDGQNVYCSKMPFAYCDGRQYLTKGHSSGGGPSGSTYVEQYGLLDDGTFGVASRYEQTWEQGRMTSAKIDGKEVDEEEARKHLERWDPENAEKVYLSSLASSNRNVGEAPLCASETITVLADTMHDSLPYSG